MTPSDASFFKLSWLCVGDIGDGDVTPPGDTGDTPFGVWVLEAAFEFVLRCAGLSLSLVASVELFRDFVTTKLFFCLNFSSQAVVRIF